MWKHQGPSPWLWIIERFVSSSRWEEGGGWQHWLLTRSVKYLAPGCQDEREMNLDTRNLSLHSRWSGKLECQKKYFSIYHHVLTQCTENIIRIIIDFVSVPLLLLLFRVMVIYNIYILVWSERVIYVLSFRYNIYSVFTNIFYLKCRPLLLYLIV